MCVFPQVVHSIPRVFSRAVLPRAGVALDSTYMGRPHCAQVFPVALAAGDALVRDIALRALVAGDAMGQDLPHDGASRLLQESGDCAPPGSNAGRSLSRNGRPRSDVAWHCPLVPWWLARLIARLNALPSPGGGELAGGSQAMHSPAWIEAWTIRLPDDTTPVELNAHPLFCTIQRTKRVRLTFPVTGADSLRGQGNCQGDSLLYL